MKVTDVIKFANAKKMADIEENNIGEDLVPFLYSSKDKLIELYQNEINMMKKIVSSPSHDFLLFEKTFAVAGGMETIKASYYTASAINDYLRAIDEFEFPENPEELTTNKLALVCGELQDFPYSSFIPAIPFKVLLGANASLKNIGILGEIDCVYSLWQDMFLYGETEKERNGTMNELKIKPGINPIPRKTWNKYKAEFGLKMCEKEELEKKKREYYIQTVNTYKWNAEHIKSLF